MNNYMQNYPAVTHLHRIAELNLKYKRGVYFENDHRL